MSQDIYLTGSPQLTFFRVIYRRHSNFAMESLVDCLDSKPTFFESCHDASEWYNYFLTNQLTMEMVRSSIIKHKKREESFPASRTIQEIANADEFVLFLQDVNRLHRQLCTGNNVLTRAFPGEVVNAIWPHVEKNVHFRAVNSLEGLVPQPTAHSPQPRIRVTP